MYRRFVGNLYRRVLHKHFLPDLAFELRMHARKEAGDYIRSHMRDAMLLEDRYALLAFALLKAREAHPNGLVCEFGVAGGKTLRHLAGGWKEVHGFDSFEGLPEDWTGTAERAGRFHQKGKLPSVPGNARLHVGWFDRTLPPFLAANAGPIALLHLDADLYSSTKTVLDLLHERLAPGSVIVFDEYLNYPAWREHEYRAFQEYVAERGRAYRYIGFSTSHGQAGVELL